MSHIYIIYMKRRYDLENKKKNITGKNVTT